MPDLAKLRDLERRLVEAEGASQELEFAIFDTLEVYRIAGWRVDLDPDGKAISGPPITASVDLALALIEEKLPKAGIDLYRFPEGVMEPQGWFAEIQPHGEMNTFEADASDPALALCTALVRALIAQEEGRG